jgi:hypothetical protein
MVAANFRDSVRECGGKGSGGDESGGDGAPPSIVKIAHFGRMIARSMPWSSQ